MRQRALLMLLLACAMGGAAVFLARGWLERQVHPAAIVAQLEAPRKSTMVVVAKLPLHFGDELNPTSLRLVEWPADAVPEGSFSTLEEILSPNERRVALRDIGVNDLVLKNRISGFGGRATLSALLAPDMRAVTIRVNDVQGVAGFVLPGDRIDVIFTRSDDPAADTRSPLPSNSDLLLQNLKVLAVDQLADSQKDKPVIAKAVTLEVSTEDAQKLTLAAQVGTLSLTLRNMGDTRESMAGTVTIADLLGRAPTLPTIAAPVQNSTVRVFRGVEETTQIIVPEGRRLPAAPPGPPDRVALAPNAAPRR